jgi:hypothetical protein
MVMFAYLLTALPGMVGLSVEGAMLAELVYLVE